MTTKLTNLRLERIDVVDKGAAPDSRILICKRDDPLTKEHRMTDEEKAKMEAEMKAKKAAEEAGEAKKRAELETIAKKAQDDLAIVTKRNEELAERVAKMEGDRERDQFIAKAAGFRHYGPADSLWQDLRDISKALGAERFAKFETRLKAVAKQVDEGKLFTELGVSGAEGPISPMAQIEKLAAERVAKGQETKEQALTAILQTDAGRKLYNDHLNTMPGMQPGSGREE